MTLYGPVGDFPIAGKVVLITGGGSGIGLALAKLCHSHGARVLVGDLKLVPEAQKFVDSTPGSEVAFQKCDVSSWASLHELITTSVRQFGIVPDVYVPCAGVFEPPWSNFWDDTEKETYKMIEINVNHPIKLTRLAMRALAGANKKGVVCLVASTAGIRANYLASLYTASKHAVVGFAKAMGQADPEEGVKVVAICPGMVASPLWTDRQDDRAKASRYRERPAMQPFDITKVVLKVVESQEYGGGTVVLKTIEMEKVVEVGYDKREKANDPSPRPDADLSHIKRVLDGERGVEWDPVYDKEA